MDRYDEVARKITGPIDESSGLDLDLARSVAAILREAFPGSAPPQEVGPNIQANGDFSQGSPPSPQAAKDARELASRIFDDCLKIEDGVNVPDEDCAAAEIERFVAARLAVQSYRPPLGKTSEWPGDISSAKDLGFVLDDIVAIDNGKPFLPILQAVALIEKHDAARLAERAPSQRFREWVEGGAKDDYPEGTRAASFTRILNQLNADKAEERAPSPSGAEDALKSIIIRCEEGAKGTDWLPIIASIARRGLPLPMSTKETK
jgi:hypothetical protein